jgi:hypothetical protein
MVHLINREARIHHNPRPTGAETFWQRIDHCGAGLKQGPVSVLHGHT